MFVWAFAPKPRMLVFGAIDFAAAVARVGAFLGYHVTVCDARPVFATNTRFPEADDVVVDWPHRYLEAEVEAGRIDRRTVITVLTHDPKFDVPLLEVALRLPEVSYVGAMGSRRTHDDRLARLREAGLDRGRDRPPLQPDRARPRRPHPRGDGDQHRRRDHRGAVGRLGRTAGRHRRPDPPRAVRDRLSRATGSLAGRDPGPAGRLHVRRTRRPSPTRRRRATPPPRVRAPPPPRSPPPRNRPSPRRPCRRSTTASRCPR